MTSIRENVMANVKTTLMGIAPDGVPATGYTTPIKQVWRWGLDSSQPVYPYLVIGDTDEKYTVRENRLYVRTLTVNVEGYAKIEFTDDDTVAAYASAFIADIEKAIVADPRRGTSNGCPNAVDTILVSNEVFVKQGAAPLLFVGLIFEVTYRTRINDPAYQTPA